MQNIQHINEAVVIQEWSPMLESVGVKDSYKLNWLSKYCHNHQMFENQSLNESSFSGTGLAQLANIPGQGAITYPTATTSPSNFYNTSYQGSGDKFPTLLPLAIQVAAKTVGFDIVNVIPMQGPTGVLPYLDWNYAGGKLTSTAANPILIQIPITGATFTVGTLYWGLSTITPSSLNSGDYGIGLTYVGKNRISGYPMFKVSSPIKYNGSSWASNDTAVADVFDGHAAIVTNSSGTPSTSAVSGATDVTGSAQLVSALEEHVYGPSGAGASDTADWSGSYVDGTKPYDPMSRSTGESTYPRSMGMQTFTKSVTAGTFQVSISVTTEQIQDMNRQFGIDLISMSESVLVNEVSQNINKNILHRAFALGWQNNYDAYLTEGITFNVTLDSADTSATSTSNYIGKENSAISWSSNVPAFADFGNWENLTVLQHRIVSKIQAASNMIHIRGRRGPGNFIVTNGQIASALAMVKGYNVAPFDSSFKQGGENLYPAGSLFGMTVYVDPNMRWDDTRILVGRKGGDMEPGLKFMPYIIAESIQIISEATMSPKLVVKSRYALVDAGFHPQTQYYTLYVKVPAQGIV